FDFCKTKELEHNQSGLKINLNVHDPEIKLDSRWHKLERVLSNLVNNSVESYSSNRPTLVDIDLFQVNEEISIIVRDYGCGIDINSRKSLFKQNFSTKPSGNGIGLFQAKAYLESIGGKIKYNPKEKGTSFKLTFPKIHTSIINQGELSSEPQHFQYSSEHSEKVLQ
ncbi:MAG: ATP-binding protein, partial [Bacteriovoracaceae bacterium]|nr:ATP-binding protein [Bacteriovoracaceae bacterium]